MGETRLVCDVSGWVPPFRMRPDGQRMAVFDGLGRRVASSSRFVWSEPKAQCIVAALNAYFAESKPLKRTTADA